MGSALLVAVALAAVFVVIRPTPVQEGVLTGHTGEVSGVVTTMLDGQPIAVSGSNDKTLRIWDLAKRAAAK